jgi:hypothetical protein
MHHDANVAREHCVGREIRQDYDVVAIRKHRRLAHSIT